MKQLIVSEKYEKGGRFSLTGKPSRYLAKVRRVLVGERIDLLCGDGKSCFARILSIEGDQVVLEMQEPLTNPSQEEISPVNLVLALALLKGKKIDGVVRKAVESGVSQILIVKTDHSVFDLKQEREKRRLERWQRIAQEAGQQSGNPHLVKVHYFDTLPQLLDHFPVLIGIVFHEKKMEKSSIHHGVSKILEKLETSTIKDVVLFIGPEGGFSKEEVELFQAREYYFAWMGSTVMRAENAALTALTSLSITIMEREEWFLVTKKK